MSKFCYEDIDLYYYHSTDIDFTRLDSILKYGILSANEIKCENVPYYHRNYINASCKDDFISISQFANTLWSHFKIKNELYESSQNKLVFVINGYIDSLEKQSHKRKGKFTPELNVKDKIKKEDILGLVVRHCDLNKEIKDIPFVMDYSNFNDSVKKCFDTILFFKDKYGMELNDNLYSLIGRLLEAKIYENEKYENILKVVSNYMQNYISEVYKIILDKDTITLKDVLLLYKESIPLYVMSKYDIGSIDEDIIMDAKERFEMTYPNRKYQVLSNEEKEKLKKEKEILSEITYLESYLRESDFRIYLEEAKGPLTKEGEEVKEKIKMLRNKIR